MSNSFSFPTLSLILLAFTLTLATSSRILEDITPYSLPPLPSEEDGPTTALPSAQAPASATDEPADQPQPNPDDTPAPLPAPVQETSRPEHPALSFYMHDVLGGSHASGRIVTGLIATSNVNGIPFSRPNNQVFPVTNGVPLVNNHLNSLFNNNNVPFVAGLNGQNQQQSQTVISNAGGGTNTATSGSNNNQAFVTPGQLPSGVSLQQLIFGSVTVIDDELTEGPELGSGVIGKGQGFYLASSLDGESHTMAFTALFPGEEGHHGEDDTVSFFGVHRTASSVSHIAVVGGTGTYKNAKGYATIEALPQHDQHTTDGVDTIARITVYVY
ncbi:dirigent protein 24-like [Silene latifolia]|uniref:dirigent protein 24-like n=1 Tax=Silene latifolia TaxID=37657 RepID=UPI003D77DD36